MVLLPRLLWRPLVPPALPELAPVLVPVLRLVAAVAPVVVMLAPAEKDTRQARNPDSGEI